MLHGRCPTSSLLQTRPPPSRLRSTSRFSRLYDLPCSDDFAPGRGGLLQFLDMSLPPCCRFHPAEVKVSHRSDFDTSYCLRLYVAGSALGSTHFRGHLRVHRRYGPVTRNLPKGDLVDGLQDFEILVSRHPLSCHPNYRALTLAPAGLSPAEHTSLTWLQLPDGQVSRVRFETLAFFRRPSQRLERFKPKSRSWRAAAAAQIADIMRNGQETRGLGGAPDG